MDKTDERRTEQRLRYYWPVWFAENFDDTLAQGQMVDVSSRGAAFTCYSHDGCPYPGQNITARFSVPHYGPDDSFDMANFTRSAHVCRVENVNSFYAVLPFSSQNRCLSIPVNRTLPNRTHKHKATDH